jgi:hypothetical protein
MGPGAVLILAHLSAPTPASRQLQDGPGESFNVVVESVNVLNTGTDLNTATVLNTNAKKLGTNNAGLTNNVAMNKGFLGELTDFGLTPETYPLGACEGDCDSDDHCSSGLVCFQRDGNTAVPGCSGNGETNNDYCVADPAKQIFSSCPAPKCKQESVSINCNGVTNTFKLDPQNGCAPPKILCPRTTFDVSQLPDWLKERVWYSLPSKWRWCADWRWWKVPFCSYGRKKEQIAKQKENADQNGRIDVDYANDGNRKLKENGDIFLQNKLYTIGEEDPKTGIDVPYLKTKCSDTCVLNHNLCVIDAVSNLPDNDQDKNQDNEQGEALAEACDICMQVWVAEEECEEGCILPYKGVLASPEIDR